MYIGDWLERGERYWPDNVAVVDVAKGEAGRFTYRQLNQRANRLANWLREVVGVQRGDRVGMLALNGVEFLDAFFACGKLGAIFVPYNWRSHWRELVDLIEVTQPSVLIYSDDFKANVAEIEQATRSRQYALRNYLHLDGDGISGSLPYEATLQAAENTSVTNQLIDAEDIICLIFTGGTTGLPKGAQISYRMIGWNTLNTIIHELQRGDITITHTPLFHTGGLLVYTLPLLTLGGTVVIMRKWTPDDMLDLIEREQVTMFFCVPSQYQTDAAIATVRDDIVQECALHDERRRTAACAHHQSLSRSARCGLQARFRHDGIWSRHLLDGAGICREKGWIDRDAQLFCRCARGR